MSASRNLRSRSAGTSSATASRLPASAPNQRLTPLAKQPNCRLQQRSRLGRRTSQEAGASKAADMGTCWFCSHRDRVKYALEWAQNIMFTSSVAVVALH